MGTEHKKCDLNFSNYVCNVLKPIKGYFKPLQLFVEKRHFFNQKNHWLNNIVYHQIAKLLLF